MKTSVFYFDDDPELLEIFEELFGEEYDVQTASNLDDAGRALVGCLPEIIICDQMMPEISGATCLSEVMSICPDSYRILLASQMIIGDALPEFGARVFHIFMTKPWTEAEMREVLERAELQFYLRRDERT